MTTEEPQKPAQGALQFYWYKTDPNEEVGRYWGQLVGSTHRLRFAMGELESVCEEEDINLALMRLAYHIENYLVRVYELRERTLSLISAVTGDKKTVTKLRHPAQRCETLTALQETAGRFVQPLEHLLTLLDEDISLRNFHTHDTFLQLGLWTNNDIYDPQEALLDLEPYPESRRQLEEVLWSEIHSLVERYLSKVDIVIQTTMVLLKRAQEDIKI